MARFYVIAKETQYYFLEVEAGTEEEAQQLGSESDAREFEYLDGGDWEIVDVQKVQQKMKQGRLF